MFDYIDFLSPPITLFHLERRTHTSKVGGCLVIIFMSICAGYISYLLYYLVAHDRVTSIFFKKFEFEAGYYSFNSSSIFHFIQIFSPECGGYFDKYDTKYIRAFTTYVHSNFKDSDLELYDHWVFDECRKDIDDKGLEPSLFDNVVNFTNAVCIRHFYNSTQKKYYSLEEEGFFWPYLEHGIAQRNNIYLMTIVQKCTNDSIINKLFGNCPSQREIDQYVSQYFGIYLYFTDTQVDPTNYTMPVQKYLQTISTGIGTNQTYVESYIHYSPIRVRTNEGSLFGDSHELNTFYFDFNRKGSANNNPKYFTITKYYHLMQNNVQIYERRYNNIFDLLSEIGGVVQFIFYLFFWVNFVYNRYIIAYDTNSLFFAVKDNEYKKIDIKKDFKSTNIIRNESNKIVNNNDNISSFKKPIQKFQSLQYITNQKKALLKLNSNNNSNSNCECEKKEDNTIIDNKRRKSEMINEGDSKKNYYMGSIKLTKNFDKNSFRRSANIIPNDPNCSQLDLREGNNIVFKKDDFTLHNFHSDTKIKKRGSRLGKTFNYGSNELDNYNKIWLSKNSIARIDHKTFRLRRVNNKERLKSIKSLSFFIYLKYLCNEEKGSTGFVIKFRKHLLSEEHLFKPHIKTILIEKELNSKHIESTNVFECFNEL
jgi:hypothetical protein